MKLLKKATVLIYVLILISILMIMAIVILNNSVVLQNTIDYQSIQSEMSNKIRQKSDLIGKYDLIFNNDGSGYLDNISCPNNITMSGDIFKSTGLISSWTSSGTNFYFCSGSYNSIPFNIFLNSDYTSFSGASYGGSNVNLIDVGSGNMSGSTSFLIDNTKISFPSISYIRSDGVDDNFNSDNYNSNSLNTYMPFYFDNDSFGRIKINGYISSSGILDNIFWSNTKSNNFILGNINNSDNLYEKISNVSTGYIILSVDKGAGIRLIKFDRNLYNTTKELSSLQSIDGNILMGTGYLQNDLSLSLVKTGNEYIFNFKDNDYALFLNNKTLGSLSYKISAETITGTGIYISPINDSFSSELVVLGGNIIINNGIYIGKQSEFTIPK